MKKVIAFLCYPHSFTSRTVDECEINIKMFDWFVGGIDDNYFDFGIDDLAVFEIKSRKRNGFFFFLNKKDVKIFKQL